MRDCLLTVTGDSGRNVAERRVVIPPLPERSLLERLWRENIEGLPCRYAVATEDRVVRALYLAEDLIPESAVRLSGRKGRIGRWLSTAVVCGDSWAGRVFVGPDLFFRQLDVSGMETWLAPLLMRFGVDTDVRSFTFGRETLYEWEFRSDRFYYWARGGRWALYGAGNTSPERVDLMIEHDRPQTASDFVWSIGAVPLVGRMPSEPPPDAPKPGRRKRVDSGPTLEPRESEMPDPAPPSEPDPA